MTYKLYGQINPEKSSYILVVSQFYKNNYSVINKLAYGSVFLFLND